MSDPVVIQLSDPAKALIGRLRDRGLRDAEVALAHELDHQNELTIGYAQKNKLSARGSTTLGVRTGRLRRSLSRSNATISGTRINGSIGSNVVYAGVHEYGFDGEVQVEGFTRRTRSRDIYKTVVRKIGVRDFDGSQRETVSRKLVAAGVSYVRPFSRHMRMPARPFIHSSLQERSAAIGAGLSKAVVKSLAGGTT